MNCEIPNFDELHEKYRKGVIRGRHPNSFRKDSEIWYRVHESSSRVNLVKSGCSIDSALDRTLRSQNEIKLNNSSVNLTTNGSSIRRVSLADTLPSLSLDYKKDLLDSSVKESHRSIAGVYLDIRDDVPIKYNGRYTLINKLDEVLCIDKKNKVKCKLPAELSSTDKFVFVLIHMHEASTDTLKFGESVWLQLAGSDNFQNKKGSVLCSRPWGKVEFTDDFGVATNVHTFHQESIQNTSSGNTDNNVLSTSNTGKSDIVGHVEVVRSGEIKGEENNGMNSRTYSHLSWHMGQWVVRLVEEPPPESTKLLSNKAKVVIAKEQAVQISYDPDKANRVTSSSYVYLEQDLYCLASARGSTFNAFPKNAKELQSRLHGTSIKYKSTSDGMVSLMGLDEEAPSSSASKKSNDLASIRRICLKSEKANASNGSNTVKESKERSTIEEQERLDATSRNGSYIDLSTARLCETVDVTMSIDPQCAWRMLPVDDGRIIDLDAKDQNSVKSAVKASSVLKKSEQGRKKRIVMLSQKLDLETSRLNKLGSDTLRKFDPAECSVFDARNVPESGLSGAADSGTVAKLTTDSFGGLLNESMLKNSLVLEKVSLAPVRFKQQNFKDFFSLMAKTVDEKLAGHKLTKSLSFDKNSIHDSSIKSNIADPEAGSSPRLLSSVQNRFSVFKP